MLLFGRYSADKINIFLASLTNPRNCYEIHSKRFGELLDVYILCEKGTRNIGPTYLAKKLDLLERIHGTEGLYFPDHSLTNLIGEIQG